LRPQRGARLEGTTDAAPYGAKADAIGDNALRVSALEVEVKLLREMLDAMCDDRDAWHEQAGKVIASLPPPSPVPVIDQPPRQ
jgi:hypothetical protein